MAGIWETAGQMADNEINPQLTQIDQLLQQAGYSADESQRAINEAYPVARRSLQKSIFENMSANEQGLAAMGTGRGGGRQELLARAGEREATGLEAIETGKQREIGAIQRALANYKGGLGTTRTSLQGQRGAKQATYSEQLRGSRFGEATTKANYGLSREQMAENSRQFNAGLELSKEQLAENARQFGEQMAENKRRFDIGNAPSAGSTGSLEGTNYFLTDTDLADLGLGAGLKPKVNTGGWAGKPIAALRGGTIYGNAKRGSYYGF